ncbi:DUF1742-domain-containing protein [Coleophoma cylindrospora]|uniref:DUF1742-domain-containing protein n=1 Tax=Coleophoma cylindrospora TaxID=1849047 RepID=A0A3D8QG65_9HELO|nr:DUF1742-domain-containing protein [Coleophoma cylindrospora]
MAAPFPNIYTHRKVADTASKACDICYKPSTSVLDFFYVCAIHLKDKGFCTPIVDEAAIAARKKREMDAEIQRVKEEFEEKQRKKKEKDNAKEKEKEKKDDSKDKDKKDGKDTEKQDDEKKKADTPATPDAEPRVFALQKAFYQQRLEKRRQIEIAKRNRERLQSPNLFPQVPKDLP